MAVPQQSLLSPPAGWAVGDFFGDLALDFKVHKTALAMGVVFGALLLLGRAYLPPTERRRLRTALVFFVAFFVLWPLRAVLLAHDLEEYYRPTALAGDVLLAWGIIGMGGHLFFDVALRRTRVPKILRDLTIIFTSLVALVALLSRSGVNLLSLITTSAVLTAVIGLALQDTIGNLLSGIALQLESSVAIGDWIRVDDKGPVGRVREIRWRSTVIQTRDGDLVVIPNGVLNKAVITNFAKDGLEHRRRVLFHVHYRHPPNLVEKVVLEALVGTPNVSTTRPPDCVVWEFRDSWVEYAVRYHLVDFQPDDPTDSAVRKRIWYALRRAGLEIPYPQVGAFVTELNEAHQRGLDEREQAARRRAVDAVTFFAPLDDEDRDYLAAGLRHQVFGRGERIIRAGEPGDSLYLVREGRVAVLIDASGGETEVATLGPGQFFGEMGLMTGEPRRATVVAREDTACDVVDHALFHEILRRKPSLAVEIGKLLVERQLELEGRRSDRESDAAAAGAGVSAQQALLGRIRSFFGLS